MSSTRVAVLVVLGLVSGLASGAIAASPDEDKVLAKQHFESGARHFDLAEYDQALAEFKEAYRLKPDATFLYNIAQCHRKLGHVEEALTFYKNYLRRAPDAPNRVEVERRIQELEAEQRAIQARKAEEESEAKEARAAKAAAEAAAEAKAAIPPSPHAETPEHQPATALPLGPLSEAVEGPATPAAVSPVPARKRLAVLEFEGAKIESDVLENFADEVRGGAVEGLAGRGVQVMTRENMMVLLKGMGKKACTEGDCEIETARNIGADFVVSGSVVRMDDAFVVTLKLRESKGGSLLATDRVEATSRLEVSRRLGEHARKLVVSTVEPSPGAPSAEKDRTPFAGSVGPVFEYSSLGGSNGVARRNVYAGALHVFLAGFSPGDPFAMDFDAALGGGPGFVYDLDLLLGTGWWFNQTVALAAVGGVGIDGITGGAAPFALKTPIRLQLALNLGAWVRVEARGGVNWLFATSDRRKHGSEAVRAFADEMVAGGRILIGKRCATNSEKDCGTLALGFTYLELLGTRSLLFMAGYGTAFDPRFE